VIWDSDPLKAPRRLYSLPHEQFAQFDLAYSSIVTLSEIQEIGPFVLAVFSKFLLFSFQETQRGSLRAAPEHHIIVSIILP
jgi:hypothetical protein